MVKKETYDDFCIDAFNFERVRKFGYEMKARENRTTNCIWLCSRYSYGYYTHHVDYTQRSFI